LFRANLLLAQIGKWSQLMEIETAIARKSVVYP
jgi:hypothetical protein